MSMIKSKKYRTHVASKYRYPTKIIRGSAGHKGGIQLGHETARKVVEARLGRRLHPGTIVRTQGGNWAFKEPKNV